MSTNAHYSAQPVIISMLSRAALAAVAMWLSFSHSQAAEQKAPMAATGKWAPLSVELPVSQALFPRGAGADAANGACLLCHSVGMVLRQPALTRDEWTAEINKMRNAFGAPVTEGRVEALAKYLYSINGRAPEAAARAPDAQAN